MHLHSDGCEVKYFQKIILYILERLFHNKIVSHL